MAWRVYKKLNQIAKNTENADKLKLRLVAYLKNLKVDDRYKD